MVMCHITQLQTMMVTCKDIVTKDCNGAENFLPASPLSDAIISQPSAFAGDSGRAGASKLSFLMTLQNLSY
jgi:hypothetical protein